MKRFLRNNGLSLVLGACFLIFWGGQALAGWKVHNEDAALHHGHGIDFASYLMSGHFWQATGENWESEFLQMAFYVVLTCFLYQKGSAESKDPDDTGRESHSHLRRFNFFYRNSLSIALVLLFILSFTLHAAGGLAEENEARAEHHLPAESMAMFLTSAQFWFQSFQNWQSEFLAVLSIVTLTIFLRQHGSPESKALDDPNSKTGG